MVTLPIAAMLILAAWRPRRRHGEQPRRAARRAAATTVRALDYPGGRKQPETVTPRLGGVAIVGGVAFAAAGVALAKWEQLSSSVIAAAHRSGDGSGAVFFVGVVDDLLGVSTWQKFGVEALAALLLVNVGWQFQSLSLRQRLAPPRSHVRLRHHRAWIVGVTNAVNCLDGLDGLAAGVVAIIAASCSSSAAARQPRHRHPDGGDTVALRLPRHDWAPARISWATRGR